MRYALASLFGATIAIAAGCGGDDDPPAGTGGGSSSTSSSASSTSAVTSSSSTSSASTGGGNGDGNDTFETAEEIDLTNEVVEGYLDPTGDEDFYQFQGNAGDALYIDINAQSLNDVSFDPAFIDTVVTLFDANQMQVAQDLNYSGSDADPRLYTVLEETGTYYLRISECWTWSTDPQGECGGTADKDETYYELLAFALDPASEQVVAEEEPNDAAAEATPVTYSAFDPTTYYVTFAYGTFATPSDVDVFRFTPPGNVAVEGRPSVRFEPTPWGTGNNGSSTPVGRLAIVDPAAPEVALAEADNATGATLWVPLELDKEYLLFVEHPGQTAGPHDFYFFTHTIGGSNPVEASDATNGDLATPEALVGEPNGELFSYFLDGDIGSAATDVDHFLVDVSAVPGATLAVSCGARTYGSGLRELVWAVHQEDGTPIAGATATEPEDGSAYLGDIAIPAGATELVVRIAAGSQAAGVSSGFYHCGIHLVP